MIELSHPIPTISVGNVAAGSDHLGWWLERMLRGPSQYFDINIGIDSQLVPLGKFEGNVAHSNIGHGFAFYCTAYHPAVPGAVENIYSFKTGEFGAFDGGVISDNMKGGVESSAGKPGKDSAPAGILGCFLCSF